MRLHRAVPWAFGLMVMGYLLMTNATADDVARNRTDAAPTQDMIYNDLAGADVSYLGITEAWIVGTPEVVTVTSDMAATDGIGMAEARATMQITMRGYAVLPTATAKALRPSAGLKVGQAAPLAERAERTTTFVDNRQQRRISP